MLFVCSMTMSHDFGFVVPFVFESTECFSPELQGRYYAQFSSSQENERLCDGPEFYYTSSVTVTANALEINTCNQGNL